MLKMRSAWPNHRRETPRSLTGTEHCLTERRVIARRQHDGVPWLVGEVGCPFHLRITGILRYPGERNLRAAAELNPVGQRRRAQPGTTLRSRVRTFESCRGHTSSPG